MSGIFDQIINYSPPLIVSGTVNYKGTWNASTNNPTLNSSPAASTKGDYYVVSTAGTQFGITFAIGDWIISNGTTWEKVDLTDAVSSVFGRTGAVVGVSTDYSAVGLTNTAIGASNPSTGAFTTVTASSTIAATGAVTGSNLSGTNTGDQTTITGNAGSATVLQTARAIYGNNFDGSAALTQAIAGTYGGTGVNNGANTITIAGNVTHAGAFTQTFTATANTSLTLPTTGALATLAGSEALSNKTITASAFNGTVGATTPSTGAFTTLSTSGTATFRDTVNIYSATISGTGGTQFVAFGNAAGVPRIQAFTAGFAAATGLNIQPSGGDTNVGGLLNVGAGLAVTGALSSTTGANFATSSGNVGIGTASPSAKLHTVSTSGFIAPNLLCTDTVGTFRIVFQSSTYAGVPANKAWLHSYDDIYIGSDGSTSFNVMSGGVNTFKVTSGGNVGIGTSAPYLSRLHILKSESGASPAAVLRVGNNGSGYTSRIVLTDENTNDANISYIGATGSLGFGLGTSLTQMVLTSAGNLLVGTTTASASPATGVQLCNTSGTLGGVFIGHDTGTANGNYYATFAYASGIIGSITQSTTSAVLYNVTSDYRRKSNVKDLTGSGAFIDALKPRTFDWDTGDKGVGFIAHEFAEVSPSSVSGEKDAVDADGKPIYQGMQAGTAEVIANLVAELQSVRQRLAALESK